MLRLWKCSHDARVGTEELAEAITKIIERFDGIEGVGRLQKIEQSSLDSSVFYLNRNKGVIVQS